MHDSVRNDAAFLATVVGVTSVVAVAAGQLPGDWGFFVPYLVGSLSLVVLAVGSVAPGLFQVVIDKFSSSQGDYQERILRHEAAHFLTAYMVGLPIVGYSLDLGKEHVNLVDESVEKRIYEGLDANLLDRLAVVSMAGTAILSYHDHVLQSQFMCQFLLITGISEEQHLHVWVKNLFYTVDCACMHACENSSVLGVVGLESSTGQNNTSGIILINPDFRILK